MHLICSLSCRIDYQYRHSISGMSSFRHLIARLPPRAHSIYYRDEIGNISTSHVWGDSRRVICLYFGKSLSHILWSEGAQIFCTEISDKQYKYLHCRHNLKLNPDFQYLVGGEHPLPLAMVCHCKTFYLSLRESESLTSHLAVPCLRLSLTISLSRQVYLFL